ncbi:MAG: hypothetical protein Q8P46_16710 [Hyphomicrobiales bacterium]|nr:hypothetical protein [Hyphomicrobiales bacterium]
MVDTSSAQMWNAIRAWTMNLEDYPGWKVWRRNRIGRTLYFEEAFPTTLEKYEAEFQFSEEVEKEHTVIIQYLGLVEAVESLKDCEYYFRRYPFRGLPVSRHRHITNVCEMFFGRFYEIKERIKKYLKAVSAVEPTHRLSIGDFIKKFDKIFEHELRERNLAHHHRRFEDLATNQVLLTGVISAGDPDKGWEREHLTAYRELSNEWVQRVRCRGAQMDEFLEAIAAATLATCSFLSALLPDEPKSSSLDRPE